MSFRAILVPVEQHDLMNSTLETALCLAQKFDSYVEGFALRGAIPAAYAMADAAAGTIPTLEQDIAENAKQTRGLFESFMQEHGRQAGWARPRRQAHRLSRHRRQRARRGRLRSGNEIR
jgi:hypothetical protein